MLPLLLAIACSAVTSTVMTPILVKLQPQAGGKYVASVSVSGTPLIQNVYTLPVGGAFQIDASLDGGATWCNEFGPSGFVFASAIANVSTSTLMVANPTHRRVSSTPSGFVEPYACGLNVTINYPTSTTP